MDDIDGESDDLYSFRQKMKNKPPELLERDLAELLNDIEFLESQVNHDIGSYSQAELMKAQEKIFKLTQKAGIIKSELRGCS